MNVFDKLNKVQKFKNTRLCIGLDPQIEKLPEVLPKNTEGLLEFNKTIIEATKNYVCSYKLNFAFYEQYGSKGFEVLEKTLEIIPNNVVKIADGKRADIGNTSKAYAKSIFEFFKFDCTTLNPFLGIDSLEPFFDYSDKLNFVLICTSNPGAMDFQKIIINDKFFFEIILEKLLASFPTQKLGFVVGATNEQEFAKIRKLAPDNFILVPGIGAQGGNLERIINKNQNKYLIVNVGRDIIFATHEKDFRSKMMEKTLHYVEQMKLV